jgi:2-polyprenyl-3-methyl-5-hydroxy-6-metoxy-1,4-benzoquinol methylase
MSQWANQTDPAARPMGPATSKLYNSVLAAWPEHAKFLSKSFANRPDDLLRTSEFIATLLLECAAANAVSLDEYITDYRYLCEQIVLPEEIYFRREERYRLSTFADAAREVYDNPALMNRYMNGLFVSDVLWFNHAAAMNDFATRYLPSVPAGGTHLEIGPGHGMLLHLAIGFGRFREMSAWDVSQTSIEHVRRILELRGCTSRIEAKLCDIYRPGVIEENRAAFDTIVFSEILEHLERPAEALAIVRELLTPEGTVWINVPANGPAPDHLFLLRSLDEARRFVESCDLEVVRATAYPVAGYSVEKAERNALPMSS